MNPPNDSKKEAFYQSTKTIFLLWERIYFDPLMSWEQKSQGLQWIYQKIPQLNRLIIEIKTKEISDGKP